MKPMMEKLAEKYVGEIQTVYMDVDKFPQLANFLKIQQVPRTYMVYQGGLIDEFNGVPPEQALERFFERAKGLPHQP